MIRLFYSPFLFDETKEYACEQGSVKTGFSKERKARKAQRRKEVIALLALFAFASPRLMPFAFFFAAGLELTEEGY